MSVAKCFFSPNTDATMRTDMCGCLNIKTEALSDKYYLGSPTLVGAGRSDCFNHFVERVCSRTCGWNKKQLRKGDSIKDNCSVNPCLCNVRI